MLGDLSILDATNPGPFLIEQGHPFRGARQGVVPAIGLLPVPSRTVRAASLFAGSSHTSIPLTVKKLTGSEGPAILQWFAPQDDLRPKAAFSDVMLPREMPCRLSQNSPRDHAPIFY
ncbi:MAG TPA: hypothetical protein VIK18_12275 [Pirellulales bacterium]